MIHPKRVAGQCAPTKSPSDGNGQAHANGKADEPNPGATAAEPSVNGQANGKAHANGKTANQEWTILVSLRFLRNQTAMTDRAFRVLVALEAYTRENRGCHPSNAALAELTGKSTSAVSRILAELERGGFIRRVPRPGGGKDRLGVMLLQRMDARLPVGENADSTPSPKSPMGLRRKRLRGPRRKRLREEGHNLEEGRRSSSSSTPPPAERTTTTTFASLPKNKSGGSKQKPTPLSDDEGLELVCTVAEKLAKLPGLVGKIRAATDLPLRCGHDWRFLAAVFVRLDAKVATREARPKDPVAYALGKMFKEMRSKKFPAAKLAALYAIVDRLLKPAPPGRREPAPRARPAPAVQIAELERVLPELEAEVAAAPNRTAKRHAQFVLDQTREKLAALKSTQHGDVQSRLAVPGTH